MEPVLTIEVGLMIVLVFMIAAVVIVAADIVSLSF